MFTILPLRRTTRHLNILMRTSGLTSTRRNGRLFLCTLPATDSVRLERPSALFVLCKQNAIVVRVTRCFIIEEAPRAAEQHATRGMMHGNVRANVSLHVRPFFFFTEKRGVFDPLVFWSLSRKHPRKHFCVHTKGHTPKITCHTVQIACHKPKITCHTPKVTGSFFFSLSSQNISGHTPD